MSFNYEEIASLDYFDSRDVVERLNEVKARLNDSGVMLSAWESGNLREELVALEWVLEELAEEFPPSKYMDVRTDTNCGVQGFAEHYAEEYAEEYAYDTGAVERGSWVERYIDWAAAADDLKEDYTEAEILGHTFYLRD